MVVIEINTFENPPGMHLLGFPPQEVVSILEQEES